MVKIKMFNFTSGRLLQMLLSLPGILVAMSFHEMAHGLAAESMGDQTARNAGRVSLNPFAHLSLLGILSMMLFGFGWAKPVPVNSYNFRNKRKGIIIVSLAGCLTNLLLAFISLLVLRLVMNFANQYLYTILYYMYLYNLVFAVFNLIPIPPLDGSQILYEFLPYNAQRTFNQISRYSYIILLICIFTGIFGMIINPIINVIGAFYNSIINFIFGLF